jgi:hypothetical protein
MEPRLRRLLVPAACALAFTLGACGNDSSGGTKEEPGDEISATPSVSVTATPPADAKVIAITITADSVEPAGTRVDVSRNQPIVLNINAEAAGELHVHSSPEKHIAFPAGSSSVEIKIDKPGVVEIEDHTLEKLIVQLEVR